MQQAGRPLEVGRRDVQLLLNEVVALQQDGPNCDLALLLNDRLLCDTSVICHSLWRLPDPKYPYKTAGKPVGFSHKCTFLAHALPFEAGPYITKSFCLPCPSITKASHNKRLRTLLLARSTKFYFTATAMQGCTECHSSNLFTFQIPNPRFVNTVRPWKTGCQNAVTILKLHALKN